MRLYISADIEGIAGVVDRPQLGPTGFEYEWARETMTDEVNAAIRGARAAGIEDILISDSHGNGQNILIDRLEQNVTLVRSWPRPLSMMEGIDTDHFVGVILLGYHAGASNMGGGLSHTMSSRVITDITLNGQPVSESMISAAIAGHFSTPVIMVTGDDIFVKESKEHFGDIPSVTTKWSSGLFSARCRQPQDVREDIERTAQQAVQTRDKYQPYDIELPIKVGLTIKSRHSAELLAYLPFITRTGAHSLSFEASDMIVFSKIFTFILGYQPDL